jgi:hypothetical protein
MFMQMLRKNMFVKLLSLGLAVALWLLAGGSKRATVDVLVPLSLRNTPTGLAVSGEVPTAIAVTVTAPKIRLLGLRPEKMRVALDLAGLGEGTVTFPAIEKRLALPPGVTLLRIYPSMVAVKLVQANRKSAP